VSTASLLLAIGGLLAPGTAAAGARWWGAWPVPVLPAFAATIGLLAVALLPLASPSGTWARLLLANALGIALLGSADPLVMTILWGGEAAVAVAEVAAQQTSSRTIVRRMMALLGGSAALGVSGALFLHFEVHDLGAVLLLGGLALRMGLLPAHAWVLDLLEHGSMGMAVCLLARQSSVFVALRFLEPIAPGPVLSVLAWLGALTAVLAGLLGLIQIRARRALGYVLLTLSGLTAFGLGLGTELGLTATTGTWLALGLSSAGFVMVIAALEARRGRLQLDRPSGSYAHVPRLATAFLLLGLASVGLPGTFGFVTEDLLFSAAIGEYPLLTVLAVLATSLAGVTVLRLFFFLFMGERELRGECDLRVHEWLTLSWVLLLLLAEGMWPGPGLAALIFH
jgi:NADH-quinone oxidoreductase subunit M